jgi:micrococcal nuclease
MTNLVKKRENLWLFAPILFLLLPVSINSCEAIDWGIVDYVPDGDTIILKDGRHVRYIGIDTPEIDRENQRATPMGYEARSLNRKLVQGQRLKIVTDRERYDHYGRILAYVFREDGLFINAELVKAGVAFCLYRYPNTSESKKLLSLQKEAMSKGRGLWKRVDRNEKPPHGYLGNKRSKRFHTHDCENGRKMSQKNRFWLKNRWEAFWQGYSPAKGCVEFP